MDKICQVQVVSDNLSLVDMGARSSETACHARQNHWNHSSDEVAGSSGVARLTCTVGVATLTTTRVAALVTAAVTGLLSTLKPTVTLTSLDDPVAGMLDHLVQASRAFGPCWLLY